MELVRGIQISRAVAKTVYGEYELTLKIESMILKEQTFQTFGRNSTPTARCPVLESTSQTASKIGSRFRDEYKEIRLLIYFFFLEGLACLGILPRFADQA
jgi:hypothetical protein